MTVFKYLRSTYFESGLKVLLLFVLFLTFCLFCVENHPVTLGDGIYHLKTYRLFLSYIGITLFSAVLLVVSIKRSNTILLLMYISASVLMSVSYLVIGSIAIFGAEDPIDITSLNTSDRTNLEKNTWCCVNGVNEQCGCYPYEGTKETQCTYGFWFCTKRTIHCRDGCVDNNELGCILIAVFSFLTLAIHIFFGVWNIYWGRREKLEEMGDTRYEEVIPITREITVDMNNEEL
ncbi:hypothetical protein EIN_419320 [Entamoeba invadens IP1]|uniref:Uncharacterized protein n=1 Tax=Entamoeba invadens IP1 TaxID=370355 RepID=A0A0A1U1U0_ENTIV|nr:hypothetical protein EIN_419320 [Entamoeba invadens IP1]ELP88003.1 hypothetical protein EIN_419320 [Entamoeba invadens IP1]|eukprot:XP_004254774.1 hypothetical protein EIN_419320 [Entamoeba invadens IP1]